jgi:hypothetical protein
MRTGASHRAHWASPLEDFALERKGPNFSLRTPICEPWGECDLTITHVMLQGKGEFGALAGFGDPGGSIAGQARTREVRCRDSPSLPCSSFMLKDAGVEQETDLLYLPAFSKGTQSHTWIALQGRVCAVERCRNTVQRARSYCDCG